MKKVHKSIVEICPMTGANIHSLVCGRTDSVLKGRIHKSSGDWRMVNCGNCKMKRNKKARKK